jgi:hypothetical protein
MLNDNNLGFFLSRLVNTKQCDCRNWIPLLPVQLTDRKCVQTVGAGKRVCSVRQFLGVGGNPKLYTNVYV